MFSYLRSEKGIQSLLTRSDTLSKQKIAVVTKRNRQITFDQTQLLSIRDRCTQRVQLVGFGFPSHLTVTADLTMETTTTSIRFCVLDKGGINGFIDMFTTGHKIGLQRIRNLHFCLYLVHE